MRRNVDKNSNGAIDFNEFIEMMLRRDSKVEEDVVHAFRYGLSPYTVYDTLIAQILRLSHYSPRGFIRVVPKGRVPKVDQPNLWHFRF